MFTDSVQPADSSSDRWLVDIAPMLNDSSLKQTLGNLDLDVPQTLTVPITVPESSALRPGQLRPLSTWGPWVSVGACVLTGVFALLTLAAARSRGKALAALGVSALLVGAAGWAGLEVDRRYIDDALNRTTGEIRQVADVMVNQAEVSLHHWLNLTLAAGGVLVVLGIIVSMLGGLRRTRIARLAMPFVTDIVGPQRPVQTWPPLVTGALRRTSTIDTHPAGTGHSDVDLRARDVVARAGPVGCARRARRTRAPRRPRHRRHRVRPARRAAGAAARAARVGPGSARRSASCFPKRSQRASLLHLLLDDWVGAALVSGYAVQHAAINLGIEEKLPPGTADTMAGICAGFAADASLVPYAKRNGTIPSVHGPVAPPLDTDVDLHPVEPLRPHGMRRFRRLDLCPVDADTAELRRALP